MPIGPTGRMNTILRPASLALRISFAISWPIFTSNSATSAQGSGLKSLFQNGWRFPASAGRFAQQRSIFAMSQPLG